MSIDFRALCVKLIDVLSKVDSDEQDVYSIERLKKIVRKIDAGVVLAPSNTVFVEDLIDSITNHTCKHRKNKGATGCAKKGRCNRLLAMPSCDYYERLLDE